MKRDILQKKRVHRLDLCKVLPTSLSSLSVVRELGFVAYNQEKSITKEVGMLENYQFYFSKLCVPFSNQNYYV